MVGRNMHVARIPEHDLDALLALYTHLNPVDDALTGRANVELLWQELLNSPRHKLFGAYVEGELVSACTISVVPNLTRGCRPYALIENVITHSAHRNQGLGQAVLAEALNFAWLQRCYKVMLLTGRRDEAIYRFYEDAGFDRNEKQAFVARPPGRARDVPPRAGWTGPRCALD